MYPSNLGLDETRQHLGKRALQTCTIRESADRQEKQRAKGEKRGSKEMLHPAAVRGFGAECCTLACSSAAEAPRTWIFLGVCARRAGSSRVLGRLREEIWLGKVGGFQT